MDDFKENRVIGRIQKLGLNKIQKILQLDFIFQVLYMYKNIFEFINFIFKCSRLNGIKIVYVMLKDYVISKNKIKYIVLR